MLKFIEFDWISGEQFSVNTFYKATNEKIEKWTQYIQNIVLKILLPIFSIPMIIQSYYKYYVLNLSEESFQLLFPALYDNFVYMSATKCQNKNYFISGFLSIGNHQSDIVLPVSCRLCRYIISLTL